MIEMSEREKELMLRLMDRAEESDTGWADHWWRELKSLRRKIYGINAVSEEMAATSR